MMLIPLTNQDMSSDRDVVRKLLREHPHLRESLEEILRVDREQEWWTFEDISVNSGDFGEIASYDLFDKDGDRYRISRPGRCREAIDGIEQDSDFSSPTGPESSNQVVGSTVARLSRHKIEIALCVIISLGLIVRLYNIGSLYFFGDEVWQVWPSKNFLIGEGFSNPVGAQNPYRRAWLTTSLPISISFLLLGYTELAARLPSIILGVSSIFLYYLLAVGIFDRKIGLLLATVLSFDTHMIMWSRWARVYAHNQFLFGVSVLLFYTWYKDGLRFTSRYAIGLGVVSLLGFHNYSGYLLLGPSIICFLLVSLSTTYLKNRWYSTEIPKALVYRQISIVLLGSITGALFIFFHGLPASVFSTPAWYSGQPADYYLQFLQSKHLILYIAFILGAVPLLFKDDDSRYLIIIFAIPFVVHSVSAFKHVRYIAHLYPLFLLIALATIVVAFRLLVEWITGKNIYNMTVSNLRLSIDNVFVISLIGLLLLFSTSPVAAALFFDKNPHGHLNDRSDHQTPANDLEPYIQQEHAVISGSPHMTMWYLGKDKTDYMLTAQRGDGRIEFRNGKRIDIRTGAVVLNGNRTDVYNVMKRYETGWFFADTRYRYYVSNEMKNTVESNMVRISSERWSNIDIYYWGPKDQLENINKNVDSVTIDSSITIDEHNWDHRQIDSHNNTTSVQGNIALGREAAGANSSTGQFTVQVDGPSSINARVYGNDSDRFVAIYASRRGEQWDRILHHNDGGWQTHSEGLSDEYRYFRIRGGSPGSSNLGGLVDRIEFKWDVE